MDAFENVDARRRQLEKSLKIQALTSAWRTVYILVKLRHWKNIDAFPALLKTVLLSAIFIIIRRFCIENSSCGAKDKVLYRFQGNISALQFRGKYFYELQTKRWLGQQGEGWGYLYIFTGIHLKTSIFFCSICSSGSKTIFFSFFVGLFHIFVYRICCIVYCV